MKFAVAATMLLTTNAALALTAPLHLDCGTLTQDQAAKLTQQMNADGLKDLARTCDEQATTFQQIATQAQATLPQNDIQSLYAKAANAHLFVASFTNEAFLK